MTRCRNCMRTNTSYNLLETSFTTHVTTYLGDDARQELHAHKHEGYQNAVGRVDRRSLQA